MNLRFLSFWVHLTDLLENGKPLLWNNFMVKEVVIGQIVLFLHVFNFSGVMNKMTSVSIVAPSEIIKQSTFSSLVELVDIDLLIQFFWTMCIVALGAILTIAISDKVSADFGLKLTLINGALLFSCTIESHVRAIISKVVD